MRAAMRWIRRHWIIVSGAAVAVAALVVVAAVWITAPQRPTSYAAGTKKAPAVLGETFRQLDDQGAPWRWGALAQVAEVLPLADGYTGRCYAAVGWVETTRAGYATASADDLAMTVAYYADGALLATGDAAAACRADDFISAAETRGYAPLQSVTENDLPLPQFYTVTYIVDDVNPDFVTFGSAATDLLTDAPADVSVYRFHEQTDYSEGPDRILYDGIFFGGRPGR